MFISIVIPAYNAEKYIIRCLDSIFAQKMDDNIEIIVVNDGSADNTLQVVHDYSESHSTIDIQVISVPNGGLANARNMGYLKIKGDYFMNLDADDFLEHGIISKLYDKKQISDYDICFYGFQEFCEEDRKYSGRYEEHFHYMNGCIGGTEAFIKKASKYIWICQGSACYRTSMLEKYDIKNIPGVDQGEDFYFIMCLLACSRTVACVPDIGVTISYHSDSMMHSSFQKSHLQVFQALDNLQNKLHTYSFLKRKNLMDAYILAEYEANRLAIAKKIADTCKWNQWRRYRRRVKKYVPAQKVFNRKLMDRKRNLESVVFHRMPVIYFYITKLYKMLHC